MYEPLSLLDVALPWCVCFILFAANDMYESAKMALSHIAIRILT